MKTVEINYPVALKIVVGLFLLLMGFLTGYRLGIHVHSRDLAGRWLSSASASSSSSLPVCRANVGNDEYGNPIQVVIPDALQYAEVIRDRHLSERDSKISSTFPRTEVGILVSHILTLSQFGPGGNHEENRIVAEDIRLVQNNPDEAFQVIRDSIDKLGREFSEEQHYLIHLVGTLELNDSQEKIEFLGNELSRPAVGTENETKQIKSNRVEALATLIEMGVDPSTLEQKLREALSGEQDYLIKNKLLATFGLKYPDSALEIKAEFGL